MAEISIKVGVDAGQALTAVEQLKAKLGQTKENIELLKAELGDLNQSLSRNDKSIASVNKQLSTMKIVTRDDAKEAAALKTQLASLSQTNSVLVTGISNTKKELIAETEVMKNLSKEVKVAEKAGSGFTSGLNGIWSGLRKIAYIVPGLGIAGLIGLLTGPLIAGFSALIDKLTDVNKLLYDTKAFNEKVSEDYAKESTSLLLLKTAIEDVNLPMGVRLQAIKNIKKEFPGLFDGLNNEQLLTGKVGDAYDKAAAAILRKARASAAADELSKIAKQKFAIEMKMLDDEAKALDRIKNARGSTANANSIGGGAFISADEDKKLTERALTFQKNADQKKLDQFKKTEDYLLKIAEQGADQIITIDDGHTKHQIKNIETIADVLAKMRRELNKLSAEEDFFGIDKSKEKIREIESAINTLVGKFKLNPKDTLIQGLFGDIKELMPLLERNFAEFKPKIAADIRLEQQQAQKEADKEFGKNPIILHGKISIERSNEDNDFTKALKSREQEVQDSLNTLGQLQAHFYKDLFTGIGEAIGDSLGKGGNVLKGTFESILHTMGKFIVELGKSAILASTLAIAIKDTFKNPVKGLLAGIAAVAIGTILSHIQLPAFADGVTNFGGGVALVGERGPELVNLPKGSDVIPNHRLSGLSGSGVQVFIPETRIRGNDLVVVYNRASNTISRNG